MYQDILVCLTEALTNGTLENMPKLLAVDMDFRLKNSPSNGKSGL